MVEPSDCLKTRFFEATRFLHEEDVSAMPATTGMKGSGYYNRYSGTQLSSIRALQDWLAEAVTNMPLPSHCEPATILDLGSSEGRNAIHMMATAVAGLRRRTDQPLQTIYNDLASNNFNQLFTSLEEARRKAVFPAGVYPSAVSGSFYDPLVPPGSVHLATSFNSILWLDQLPSVAVSDFVAYRRPHPLRPGLTPSPETTAAFTRQAEQDLVRFLACRASELVPGGKLLLASPGDTDEARVSDGFSDLLNDACLDLVADGCLSRGEYERLTMPVYFRTLAELLAPLGQPGSPVYGAFTVDRAQSLEVSTPFVAEFRRGGDVGAYAGAYTGFVRAISEPVVRSSLNQNGTAAVTVERLYDRARVRLLADPDRYAWRYFMVAALLTRR
jgi:hypothetical protein